MAIYGECEDCMGATVNYVCANCLEIELKSERAAHARTKAKLRELVAENEALREERVELLVEVLHYSSFDASEKGWYYHSCMSSQEYALRELVQMGEYELHPEWYDDPGRAWFRPVAKD